MAVPDSTTRGEKADGGGGAPRLRQAGCEAGVVGLVAASAAIALSVSEPAPWLNRDAYLLALSGLFFAGVTQVAASVWAAGGRRGAAGRKLVYAPLVVPLVIADGLAPKLRQADFGGGVVGIVAASAAITLSVIEPPPWLNRDAYFLAFSGVFFAGVTQVAASVWAADGRRGAAGRKLVYASLVVPFVVAGGLALAPLFL